ncbi:competence protein CoiA family protein [Bacillus badius]|uniref:competence protein CoiA n=1 Tax=Bacillus badius TaxID=1455 RepID=UPI002E1A75A6|nr:competence protein CoiA family protein [Bacillus badius]
MLIAIDQSGEVISLAQQPNEQMLGKIRASIYFCPACREPVILKAGAVKIPHFAHKQSHACKSFSEGESARHLKGKSDLYRWIRSTHEVKLEAYLPEIAQRPDLLVEEKTAIEYQCSALPAALFLKRTEGYRQQHVFPFWIYGGPPIKKQGPFYSFSLFHRLFFHYSLSFGFWLLAYCPDQEYFTLYSQLTPVYPSLYAAAVQNIPLCSLAYPPAFDAASPFQPFSLSDWFLRTERWLQQQIYFTKGLSGPFFHTVYQSKNHPSLLPLCIGLPVRFMALIKSHPIEWQFYLWHDLLAYQENATAEEAAAVIKKRIEKGDVQLNQLPLCLSLDLPDVMEEYLAIWRAAGAVNKEPCRTVCEQMERKRAFIRNFEEFIISRLIF